MIISSDKAKVTFECENNYEKKLLKALFSMTTVKHVLSADKELWMNLNDNYAEKIKEVAVKALSKGKSFRIPMINQVPQLDTYVELLKEIGQSESEPEVNELN